MPRKPSKKVIRERGQAVRQFIMNLPGIELGGPYEYRLHTKLGQLSIAVHDAEYLSQVSVMTRFEDPQLASKKIALPISGKHNFHYEIDVPTKDIIDDLTRFFSSSIWK